VLDPDGATRVLAATGLVVTDSDGAPLRVVGIDQDITERIRVSNELAQHQFHLQELVDERTVELRDAMVRAEAACPACREPKPRSRDPFWPAALQRLRTALAAFSG